MLTAVVGEPSDSGMIIGSLETLQKIYTHNRLASALQTWCHMIIT